MHTSSRGLSTDDKQIGHCVALESTTEAPVSLSVKDGGDQVWDGPSPLLPSSSGHLCVAVVCADTPKCTNVLHCVASKDYSTVQMPVSECCVHSYGAEEGENGGPSDVSCQSFWW